MSYLKQLTDADQAMCAPGAGPCMHIKVPYSLAAEVAKKADVLDGYRAERVKTYWQEETAWQLVTPSDHMFIVEDSDESEFAVLAREIIQLAGCAAPDRTPAPKPKPEPIFLVWTDADSRAAVAEGWDVWEVSGMVDRNHLAIQRVDERHLFDSDDEAVMHVYDRAVRDLSPLHRKAFAITLQAKP